MAPIAIAVGGSRGPALGRGCRARRKAQQVTETRRRTRPPNGTPWPARHIALFRFRRRGTPMQPLIGSIGSGVMRACRGCTGRWTRWPDTGTPHTRRAVVFESSGTDPSERQLQRQLTWRAWKVRGCTQRGRGRIHVGVAEIVRFSTLKPLAGAQLARMDQRRSSWRASDRLHMPGDAHVASLMPNTPLAPWAGDVLNVQVLSRCARAGLHHRTRHIGTVADPPR